MEQKTNKISKRGFTLIELLIVIGILSVLTAAVVVVLNPAELLAQARDTQRMSDLDAIRSTLSLYLSTATTTDFSSAGPYAQGSTASCFSLSGVCGARDIYTIGGLGWVAVDLTVMSNPGSPISALPRDPTNGATYHYAYKGNNTYKTFELNCELESNKYAGPRESGDGGDSTTIYEVGSDTGLDL
ncbi:MAG: hypothetical protein UV58_C0004G0011 [Candidatus Wolfebacteria bacterium GW2011_GWC1_43_10]|uniref:General secretion pathway protein G n=1 Tax=Candidatus Wolfebacteria bacterium GW2011_GWC1_43_10 TaxID=1619011 RepID=A0A0G1F7L1_9BACT|nr:MAG: hypothetical protein UV58_C0004G0011 [Candidatus Wolfebacteria bacterium GW2011_GWC1_43_10]